MEKQLINKQNELPKGAVMAKEVAEKELEAWFDYRRVKEKVRNNPDENLGYDVTREALVDGFMYGFLRFDSETGVLIQSLEWPVENESKEVILKELNWKPRIKERELTEPMKGVKATDTNGRMKAYISAYTGVVKTKLGALDLASDYALAQSINTYFLL